MHAIHSPRSSLLSARIVYATLAMATIVLGLAVHLRGHFLGVTLQDVIGDALWAAMIAWWVAAVVPAASVPHRSLAALAICFSVEFSQLYHAPVLDALRRTPAGQLTLGSGFDPRDLLAYTLGVLATVFAEVVRRRLTSPRNAQGECP